jgi:uncharacterized membrane protein (DUF2068 family)
VTADFSSFQLAGQTPIVSHLRDADVGSRSRDAVISNCREAGVSEIKMHKAPQRWPLVLIALDKFVKGTGLLVISFFLTVAWRHRVQVWIDDAQTTPHNWLVENSLKWIEGLLEHQVGAHLPLVRICVVIYAGLYYIEAVGLYYERKWAEWMVVIGTAAFLPLEIYDFCKNPRWFTVLVFALNLLMAAYLLWRLHRQKIVKREREALGKLAVEASEESER